jgi:transcription initiation factor TFIID subunit TAF12
VVTKQIRNVIDFGQLTLFFFTIRLHVHEIQTVMTTNGHVHLNTSKRRQRRQVQQVQEQQWQQQQSQ